MYLTVSHVKVPIMTLNGKILNQSTIDKKLEMKKFIVTSTVLVMIILLLPMMTGDDSDSSRINRE